MTDMTDHFYWCSRGLICLGCPLDKEPKKYFVVISTIALIIITILCYVKIFIDRSLESLEIICIFLAIWSKYLVIILKRKEMIETYKMTNLFWKDDLRHTKNRDVAMYFSGHKYYATYFIIGFFITALKSLIVRDTIYYCYIPEGIPKKAVIALEWLVVYISVATLCAFSIFLCTSVILALAQFRLLNFRLANLNLGDVKTDLDREMCSEKIKECAIHHNLLIRFINHLNDLVSLSITVGIGAVTLLLCANVYMMRGVIGPSHPTFYRMVITSTSVPLEFLFVYGYPLQLLEDEAQYISENIYLNCAWYLPNMLSIRKSLHIMMLASQRPLYIATKNGIKINNQTILLILRTAYSFYTFLETVG